MKKETRGRKPSKDKKQTVCLYIETSKIKKAGGIEKMKERLYVACDKTNQRESIIDFLTFYMGDENSLLPSEMTEVVDLWVDE
jgi:hypothetical protein